MQVCEAICQDAIDPHLNAKLRTHPPTHVCIYDCMYVLRAHIRLHLASRPTARLPCTPPGSACGASWTQVASLTLAPLHAGNIHYQLPDGTECGKRAEGAVKLTTGGLAAKGALPSVQAPLTYAH